MEFWLMRDRDKFMLPVPPSDYKIKTSNNNTAVVVEDIGEINILGRTKLSEISISSFFPNQKYYFCKTTPLLPYDYVNKIETWRLEYKPIRLVITGTPINTLFSIEDFEYGEQDGTGNVHFTITLKEYKVIKEKTL